MEIESVEVVLVAIVQISPAPILRELLKLLILRSILKGEVEFGRGLLTVTEKPLAPKGVSPLQMLVQVAPPEINLVSEGTSTSRIKVSGCGMLRVRVIR